MAEQHHNTVEVLVRIQLINGVEVVSNVLTLIDIEYYNLTRL